MILRLIIFLTLLGVKARDTIKFSRNYMETTARIADLLLHGDIPIRFDDADLKSTVWYTFLFHAAKVMQAMLTSHFFR